MKRFATLILILTLSLAPFLTTSYALQVVDGSVDLNTIATTSTLDATHLVVGEVIHVSFVFQMDVDGGTTGPLSIVTLRVDWDMKKEIEGAENDPPKKGKSDEEPEQVVEELEQVVLFSQIGGPYPDGDYVEAAGIRLLELGDYVFLRLSPTTFPITNSAVTVNNCTKAFGAVHTVDDEGNEDIDQHIIKKGWRSLDLTVVEMTRIVRATLKRPEEMRAFERDLTGPTKELRYKALMDKVKSIEGDLSLRELNHQ